MKKIICFALLLTLISSTCFALTPDEAASDIGKYGIMSGFPDGTLRLEQDVTRAQMVKMLVTALGETDYSVRPFDFIDVPNSHWAYQYIQYARANNIVGGFPDGTFKPDDNVTREQAVKMVICALQYDKYELSNRLNKPELVYPQDYIHLASKINIIVPAEYGDGKQNATRGFVASVLSRALDVPLPYDPNPNGYFSDGTNVDPRWKLADGLNGRELKTWRIALEE